MTWTLLALGTALAVPAAARAAEDRRGRGGGAQRPSPRAGGRGAHHAVTAASRFARPVELAAAAFARGRRGARLGDHPHLSQLRLLLPPGLGAAAAGRARADLHGLRRADAAPALRRARRACWGWSSARARIASWCSSACSRTRRSCSAPTGSARRSSGAGAARWARCSSPPARRSCSTPRAATSTRRSWRSSSGRASTRLKAAGPGGRWRCSWPPGLLRPEAWVLGGLLWLWCVTRSPHRVRLTLAMVAAPVIWALVDLVVTGDPLHSLHATTELADDLGRVRGLEHVPGSFVSFVGATVRPPVALLAPIGAVLAVRLLGWQRAARAAGAVRGRRDHVRRHRRARPLDPAALPDRARGRAVPVRRLRAARLHGAAARARLAQRWAQGSAAATVVGAIGLDHPRAVADQRPRGAALHPQHPRQPDRAARRSGGARRTCAAAR